MDPLDARQHAPATDRNRDPILVVLKRVLPPSGTVLELASGTGEHGVYFAPQLSPRCWLPTDLSLAACASIAAWRDHLQPQGLCPPLPLDVTAPHWPIENSLDESHPVDPPITAIVAINMIHIAPWQATLGLLAGAGRILPPGGILYVYGPFYRRGSPTAPSNQAFDADLRAQDPEWGLRELERVVEAAAACDLQLKEVVEMPAHNLSVIWSRSGSR